MENVMKQILMIVAAVLAVSCAHHGGGVQADVAPEDCVADTLWADDSSWCDIQQPFVENGRQVLYRHTTFYDGDTQVMDYVYIPRGSDEHARRVKELFGDTGRAPYVDDLFASYGLPCTHVDLGDLPRDWFVVMRYRGTPVFTADYPYYLHFTDSTLVHHGLEDWVDHLCGVEKLPDGGYALKLERFDFEQGRVVSCIDTLPPLGKDHCVHFAGWLLTTREHLKDFDLIDVDNWIELVDPLVGDYRF